MIARPFWHKTLKLEKSASTARSVSLPGSPYIEEARYFLRHGCRCPIPSHAHENKFRLSNQDVVRRAPGCLVHRKARPAEMRLLSVETQTVTRKRTSMVLYRGLADRRPRIVASENVNAGSLVDSLPSGLFEKSQKGRLIDVSERITVVGIYEEFN